MATLIQPSFAAGELGPSLYGRVDIAKYAVGLRTAKNIVIHPHGGASNRAGMEWIGYARKHTASPRLISFQFNTTQTYILEFTDLALRVIKDGGYVLDGSPMTITGATAANPVVISYTGTDPANGDDVFISGVVGMTRLNGRWFKVANVNAGANTFELTDQVTGANINGTGFAAYVSGGTAEKIYTVVTPYAAADLRRLKFEQSADVMTITHPTYQTRELSRTGHASWSLATISFAPTIGTPSGWAGTPATAGSTTYKYRVTAVATETFEESLAQDVTVASAASTLSATNTISLSTASATTNALKYNFYRQKNGGVYGFIGSSETTSFVDDGVTPDTGETPPTARDPISSAGEYPGAVSYFEQRRVFGGSTNKPDTKFYTQTGRTKNMNVSSPSRDDDAITATLNARQVNEIRHFVPLDDLLVFTAGAEWKVSAGSDSAFSAATLRQKPQSYWGSSHVRPIVVGKTVLFFTRSGNGVRSMGYDASAAGYTGGYDGQDLTILANHLFEQKEIVDAAYAQTPDSLVWVVLDDGTALSLTFNKEQQVTAWSRHETDGEFEAVASVPETADNEDAVYFVVKRTINGQTVRYVERLHTRYFAEPEECFFVDAGVTYEGAATATITGLDHLEGETVVALADGNVVSGLTVANGAVTLPRAAETVHVGLAYTADLETLNVEVSPGTIQGKSKKISEVVLRFLKSRGLWIGPTFDNLTEMKWREDEVMGAPTALLTGDKKQTMPPAWNTNGRIAIRQSYPLPMTILAIIPELTVGG